MTGQRLVTFDLIADDVSEWFTQTWNDDLQNIGKAPVLALRLQHALHSVRRAVNREPNISKSTLESAWSLLRSMMVELREETQNNKSQLPVFYELLEAAEAAEDSVDPAALRTFLITPWKRLSRAAVSETGPSKWWLAFDHGLPLTLENVRGFDDFEDAEAGMSSVSHIMLYVTTGEDIDVTSLLDDAVDEDDVFWSIRWPDAIRLPQSVLCSLHPPESIEGYVYNFHHPSNIWADWSMMAMETSIHELRRALEDGDVVLPLEVLWILPAMNGLTSPPMKFRSGLTDNGFCDKDQTSDDSAASTPDPIQSGNEEASGVPPHVHSDEEATLLDATAVIEDHSHLSLTSDIRARVSPPPEQLGQARASRVDGALGGHVLQDDREPAELTFEEMFQREMDRLRNEEMSHVTHSVASLRLQAESGTTSDGTSAGPSAISKISQRRSISDDISAEEFAILMKRMDDMENRANARGRQATNDLRELLREETDKIRARA
ncbi:unnamed protein product [Peniophora sp. CBMAI 1063]|nr:unnamed protein product [Peniophora sp. CBMAI 1063]